MDIEIEITSKLNLKDLMNTLEKARFQLATGETRLNKEKRFYLIDKFEEITEALDEVINEVG